MREHRFAITDTLKFKNTLLKILFSGWFLKLVIIRKTEEITYTNYLEYNKTQKLKKENARLFNKHFFKIGLEGIKQFGLDIYLIKYTSINSQWVRIKYKK